MVGASDPGGQGFHCRVVLLARQLASNKPVGNGFSLWTRLKSFHSHTGKGILHSFGTQLSFSAIDILSRGHSGELQASRYLKRLPHEHPLVLPQVMQR